MVEILSLIIVCSILLLVYMLIEAFSNTVKKECFSFKDFPESAEPLHIFFISDIHKRVIHDKIISEVRGKTDIVIIGGDLTEKGVPFNRIRRNIRKLKELGQVYFIWGNNDYEVNIDTFRQLLQSEGVILLENSSVLLKDHPQHPIILLGVEDLSLKRDNIKKAFETVPDGAFKILAAHNPDMVRNWMKKGKSISCLAAIRTEGKSRFLGLGLYQKGANQSNWGYDCSDQQWLWYDSLAFKAWRTS